MASSALGNVEQSAIDDSRPTVGHDSKVVEDHDINVDDDEAAIRELAAASLAQAAANPDASAAAATMTARVKRAALWAVRKASTYVSFLPMILVAALPDLRLAAAIACGVAVANFAASSLLRWARVYRVWPKAFDLVNVAIYASVLAATLTRRDAMARLTPVVVSGANGAYFLVSLLLNKPFTLEMSKESAPRHFWGNPAFLRLNWRISAAWAAALWVVTLAAAAYAIVCSVSGSESQPLYLALDVALGIAPLVAAVAAQHLMVHRFRRRVRAAAAEMAAAAARGGGGGDGKAAV